MLSDVVPARLRVEQADLNLSFTVAPSRHVVVLTKTNSESTDVTSSETEAGACVRLRRAAVDVIPAPIRPELS